MSEVSMFSYSYTAVGVFVLGRLFHEAWGKEAPKMQAEFNDFLEVFHVLHNISQDLMIFLSVKIISKLIQIEVEYRLEQRIINFVYFFVVVSVYRTITQENM